MHAQLCNAPLGFTLNNCLAPVPSRRPAGVYVGCMYQEYPGLLAEAGMKLSAAAATGSSLSFMVGRVSYTFGLQGGCAWAAACCVLQQIHR